MTGLRVGETKAGGARVRGVAEPTAVVERTIETRFSVSRARRTFPHFFRVCAIESKCSGKHPAIIVKIYSIRGVV